MDLARLSFALMVLLSHAPVLTDGNNSREYFVQLTQAGVTQGEITLGGLAVFGFFLLSGSLIVKSWISDPDLASFLRKRALRIVPGYLVAALLSTLVVGALAAEEPHFFQHLGKPFAISILTLNPPITPKVLRGVPQASVNSSLWTISYECRCYLLVALFGVTRLLQRRYLWLLLTVICNLFVIMPWLHHPFDWTKHVLFFGIPDQLFLLAAPFLVGGCFHLYRDVIPMRAWLAASCAVLLALSSHFRFYFPTSLVVFGGYILFYLLRALRSPEFLDGLPDISYGVYLYGWPIQVLWIWYFHPSPWLTFFVSAGISICFGWVSWVFIERPSLKLKASGSAPLPVST